MRKTFFVLPLLMIVFFAHGQEQDTLKARAGDWGFALNITGLINNIGLSNNTDIVGNNVIFAKRFLTDQHVLRIGVGFTVENTAWHTEDSVGKAFVQVDSSYTRNSVSINPGYEFHVNTGMRRLDPYIGGSLPFAVVGRTKIKSDTKTTEAIGESLLQRIIQEEGGVGFGVQGIIGFNYFVAERLSLGAEYKFGYTVTVLGGNISESVIDDPASGSSTSVFSNSQDKVTTQNVVVSSIANLHLSFYF